MSNEPILQRVTRDFLQGATSATNNERILERVKSDIWQQATLQEITSEFWNE